MNKYQELCDSFSVAQEKFSVYRDECLYFGDELWRRMMGYLQVPNNKRLLYKIGEKGEFKLVPAQVINAIELRPDNYWQLGLGFVLKQNEDNVPSETIQIPVLFRREHKEAKFYVRLFDEKTDHVITQGDEDSFVAFFDFIFDLIVSNYKDEDTSFSDEVETIKKIGFKMEKDIKEEGETTEK